MSAPIRLGCLQLSCPSTGLDLALTSNASISTLAQSCSSDTPSLADIESGRVWLAPTTNAKLSLAITWPSSTSNQRSNALRACLLTAVRHAAVSTTSLYSATIELTSLNIPAMEPIEPSIFSYCGAFAVLKHMFPCHIIDPCVSAHTYQETAHSSSRKGCTLQPSQASGGSATLESRPGASGIRYHITIPVLRIRC
jgi:hypothetical protein